MRSEIFKLSPGPPCAPDCEAACEKVEASGHGMKRRRRTMRIRAPGNTGPPGKLAYMLLPCSREGPRDNINEHVYFKSAVEEPDTEKTHCMIHGSGISGIQKPVCIVRKHGRYACCSQKYGWHPPHRFFIGSTLKNDASYKI